MPLINKGRFLPFLLLLGTYPESPIIIIFIPHFFLHDTFGSFPFSGSFSFNCFFLFSDIEIIGRGSKNPVVGYWLGTFWNTITREHCSIASSCKKIGLVQCNVCLMIDVRPLRILSISQIYRQPFGCRILPVVVVHVGEQ